jgi:hypothetical protein
VNTRNAVGDSVGHCCPKPYPGAQKITAACPFDISDPKGTCPDFSDMPVDKPIPKDKLRTCSYTTHDCVRVPGDIYAAACCPIPCHGASSHFNIKGKCYDFAQIGDVCEYPAQCSGGANCVSQGSGKPLCLCKGKVLDDPSPHCA